jgi:hypothetical protein
LNGIIDISTRRHPDKSYILGISAQDKIYEYNASINSNNTIRTYNLPSIAQYVDTIKYTRNYEKLFASMNASTMMVYDCATG